MFEISAPGFRPLNANLTLCVIQAAFFLGPILGGALVARRDITAILLSALE